MSSIFKTLAMVSIVIVIGIASVNADGHLANNQSCGIFMTASMDPSSGVSAPSTREDAVAVGGGYAGDAFDCFVAKCEAVSSGSGAEEGPDWGCRMASCAAEIALCIASDGDTTDNNDLNDDYFNEYYSCESSFLRYCNSSWYDLEFDRYIACGSVISFCIWTKVDKIGEG